MQAGTPPDPFAQFLGIAFVATPFAIAVFASLLVGTVGLFFGLIIGAKDPFSGFIIPFTMCLFWSGAAALYFVATHWLLIPAYRRVREQSLKTRFAAVVYAGLASAVVMVAIFCGPQWFNGVPVGWREIRDTALLGLGVSVFFTSWFFLVVARLHRSSVT
jgi:hypothetical protein